MKVKVILSAVALLCVGFAAQAQEVSCCLSAGYELYD